MANGKPTEISAADAVKFFRNLGVQVRTARPATIKGEDGKSRPGFLTDVVALAAQHILAAVDHGDRVAVVTIDGKRHEAPKGRDKTEA